MNSVRLNSKSFVNNLSMFNDSFTMNSILGMNSVY